MEMTETFISAAEFSRLSGLSPATVSRYISSGKISTVISPLGKRVIPISEIDRLVPETRKERIGKEKEISKIQIIPQIETNQKELELLRGQIGILQNALDMMTKQLEFLGKQNSDLWGQLKASEDARTKLETALLALPTSKAKQQRDEKGRFSSGAK